MATNSSLNSTSPHSCFTDPNSMYVFTSFTAATLLLLPLSAFVLYLGFDQWKRRRPVSHLDHFTYHMAAMEVAPACACVLYCLGVLSKNAELMRYGIVLFAPAWSSKLHFNSFTCVERYLAVVHPITYRGLKQTGGARIRNWSIGFLWLLALFWTIASLFLFVSDVAQIVAFLFSLVLAFGIMAFCNLSVLRVLIRPSPAKAAGSKGKVDQSKRRAFRTVAIIFGMLVFGAVGMMTCEMLSLASADGDCTMYNKGMFFSLPCNLVLPLLFLHRTGRFSCNGEAKSAA